MVKFYSYPIVTEILPKGLCVNITKMTQLKELTITIYPVKAVQIDLSTANIEALNSIASLRVIIFRCRSLSIKSIKLLEKKWELKSRKLSGGYTNGEWIEYTAIRK